MAMKEYVMTAWMRQRLLKQRTLKHIPSLEQWKTQRHINHRTASKFSMNCNSHRYRQAQLGEINCRTCGADLPVGKIVRSRVGHRGRAILRCKECDIKVYGNGKED